MDRIKKLKIKKQDGTFSDYIPIGADAENIDTTDGESVQLKLNKKPYYYNSVTDMKADTKLKTGDMAITLGYYEANDGGNGEYRIVSGNYTDDGGSYHQLNNNLFAELVINNEINIKQFGAYGDGIHDDTSYLQLAIDSYEKIYIPEGTYKIMGLLLRDNIEVYGCGTNTILKSDINSYNNYFIDASTNTVSGQIILRDLCIYAGQFLSTNCYGLVVEHGSKYIFDNIKIKNFGKAGLWVKRQVDSFFNNIFISLCYDGCVVSSTDCFFNNIICAQMQRHGLYIGSFKENDSIKNNNGSGLSNYFNNCKVYGTGYDINTYGAGVYMVSSHCIFNNLVIQETYQDGLFLSGNANQFRNINIESIGRIRDDDISLSKLDTKMINIKYDSTFIKSKICGYNVIYGNAYYGNLPGYANYGVYIENPTFCIANDINLNIFIERAYVWSPNNKTYNTNTGKIIENYTRPIFIECKMNGNDNFTNKIQINHVEIEQSEVNNLSSITPTFEKWAADGLTNQITYTHDFSNQILNYNITTFPRKTNQLITGKFRIWNYNNDNIFPKIIIARAKVKTSNQNYCAQITFNSDAILSSYNKLFDWSTACTKDYTYVYSAIDLTEVNNFTYIDLFCRGVSDSSKDYNLDDDSPVDMYFKDIEYQIMY